jgi:hypothetical protein
MKGDAAMTDIQRAGAIISEAAMKVVAQHPRMTADKIDAVIAGMKAATPGIVDRLIDDITEAPTVSMYAIKAAIAELALAGIKEIGGEVIH